MSFLKITEQPSYYRHLEKMSVSEILTNINTEDKIVPDAVERVIPEIQLLVTAITDKLKNGGRLFYIGSGTSGRMGILDASESPPTFGVPHNLLIGIIAGGNKAITKAVEFAEDDEKQGWKDLQSYNINNKDIVVGIAASGTTPYVISALKKCKEFSITTGSISCNPNSPISDVVDFPIEVIVGPEFVTGSTRMKCGTAQKLILNMISTTVMVQLGKVEDNMMINMQLNNEKLIDRGVKFVMDQTGKNYKDAKKILLNSGSVKKALHS